MQHNLSQADLTFNANGEPVSQQFDDVYYCPNQAREEIEHVFLQGNDLFKRFEEGADFSIAETGFGTGANFLAAWDLWDKVGSEDASLTFVSFEQYPLTKEHLAKVHKQWPELARFSEQLLEQYPFMLPGFHYLKFDQGRVNLLLIFGDVNETIEQFDGEVDAWFLDGFAPSKNPEMWNELLLEKIAAKTKSQGSFATFTAAGAVRRGLEQAGFTVEKVSGFGKKREMLKGVLPKVKEKPANGTLKEKPWFWLPKIKYKDKHAAIIGAGLAGASTAYSLAQRGYHVTLIDRHPEPAMEASGNPAGIVMPMIASPEDRVGQFNLTACQYALRHYQQIQNEIADIEWDPKGIVQLYSQDPKRRRYKSVPNHPATHAGLMREITQKEASDLCGIGVKSGGVFFPHAGSVNPRKLCRAYIDAFPEQISCLYNTEIAALEEVEGKWQLSDNEGNSIITSEIVIVTNANEGKKLLPLSWLPTRPVRGQLTYVKDESIKGNLECILCYEGYYLPGDKHSIIGSTFGVDDCSTQVRTKDHMENLNMLNNNIVHPLQFEQEVEGRAAVRAVSPDRRPMVGLVPEISQCEVIYNTIHKGNPYEQYQNGAYYKGLYVSVGHGSRGLVSTPISAEYITALLEGVPLPMDEITNNNLNSVRFIVRMIKSNA